jgi:AraC-like DNA-binding protein
VSLIVDQNLFFKISIPAQTGHQVNIQADFSHKRKLDELAKTIQIHYDPVTLWQHQYPESARQSVEIAMAGILKIFKTLSGKKIFPAHVALAYPARSLGEYERIFQSVIRFQSKRNTITFRKSDLLLTVISYDKSLFAFFNSALDQKLKSLRKNERLSDRLKQMIINDFKGRPTAIDIAASHFNMTARSLQRKLKEEQRSYRDIVTDIRKELAQTILTRTDFRIGEVAEILGYSDSSSFRKAFRKWSDL